MKWISVDERMPRAYFWVLVACKSTNNRLSDLEIAYLTPSGWRTTTYELISNSDITHWMPLPEPYRESEEQ